MVPSTKPSLNRLALQKSLVRDGHQRKRRKIDHGGPSTSVPDTTSAFPRGTSSLPSHRRDFEGPNHNIDLETAEAKNGESIATLRRMVLGKVEYTTSQTAPGKYVAIDCEMVGVGIEGSESSLARVSIVNYAGAVILDVFVRQRERVVDYRTQWSGIRSTDLAGSAKSFKEVQQTVADVIKDRILVGHAIRNDLKALLLSHPSPQIRDTQSLAYKHRVVKSRRPALRVLVKQELGIVIQGGEHSSVTDARATMALFRLFKKQWEKGFRPVHTLAHSQSKNKANDDLTSTTARPVQSTSPSRPSLTRDRKRKHSEVSKSHDDDVDRETEASSSSLRPRTPSSDVPSIQPPSQQIPASAKNRKQGSRLLPPANPGKRKGISSGISTVTRRPGGAKEIRKKGAPIGGDIGEQGGSSRNGSKGGKHTKERWWESLGGGKKGSIKL